MEVTSSEIVKGTVNRRTRRVTGLTGGVITFETSGDIFQDSVVSINFNGGSQYYHVQEISTINGISVEVAATEYGYWADYPSKDKSFDVRSLIGLHVSVVTDDDILQGLRNSNAFT